MIARRTGIASLLLLVTLTASRVSAGQLRDGTRIPVRLLSFISSETSKEGDPVEFVVTTDVVANGQVLIPRGTRVLGSIVKARQARWGFSANRHARLAFAFTYTVANNGVLVRLRGPAPPRSDGRPGVDRDGLHHAFQWAGTADTFEAFVDGDYDV
jgi:type IV secretory pathway VirB10-like protein